MSAQRPGESGGGLQKFNGKQICTFILPVPQSKCWQDGQGWWRERKRETHTHRGRVITDAQKEIKRKHSRANKPTSLTCVASFTAQTVSRDSLSTESMNEKRTAFCAVRMTRLLTHRCGVSYIGDTILLINSL